MVEVTPTDKSTPKVREYRTTFEKYNRYKQALTEVKAAYKEAEDIKEYVASHHSAEMQKDTFERAKNVNARLKVLQSEIRYLAVTIMNEIVEAGMTDMSDEGLQACTLTAGELMQEFLKFPLNSPVAITEGTSSGQYFALFDVVYRSVEGAVIIETAEDISEKFEDGNVMG